MTERITRRIPEKTDASSENQISQEEALELAFKSILDQYFPDGYDPEQMTDKIRGEMMVDMLSFAMQLPKNAEFISRMKNLGFSN